MQAKKIQETKIIYVASDGKEFPNEFECKCHEKLLLACYYYKKIQDIPVKEYLPPMSDNRDKHNWYYVKSSDELTLILNYYNARYYAGDIRDETFDVKRIIKEFSNVKYPQWICFTESDFNVWLHSTLDIYLEKVEQMKNALLKI